MKAEAKPARQRLGVLQLAQALGNVAAACRQRQSAGQITSQMPPADAIGEDIHDHCQVGELDP